MKKQVFLKAWAIFRELETESFANCLRFAWCTISKGLESFTSYKVSIRKDFRGTTHADYSASVGDTKYFSGSIYSLFHKVTNHINQNNEAAAYTYGAGLYCGD